MKMKLHLNLKEGYVYLVAEGEVSETEHRFLMRRASDYDYAEGKYYFFITSLPAAVEYIQQGIEKETRGIIEEIEEARKVEKLIEDFSEEIEL